MIILLSPFHLPIPTAGHTHLLLTVHIERNSEDERY